MIQISNIKTALRNRVKNAKRYLPLTTLVVVVVAVLSLFVYSIGKLMQKPSVSDPRVTILDAKASQILNRDFEFPILDGNKIEVTKLKLHFDTIDKRDQLVVNGKTATSVKGRTFLVVSIKVNNNEYGNPIQVNMSNYVRMTVNGNESELLAPEIHSDPVVIQSESTKLTRVGFPVNDSDKNIVLWVGEIKGKKEKIEITI